MDHILISNNKILQEKFKLNLVTFGPVVSEKKLSIAYDEGYMTIDYDGCFVIQKPQVVFLVN